MALLRALLELKQRAGGAGRVYAGHVNHQLRGESMADEQWLKQQCQRLGVELLVRRVDTATLAAERGDGLEAAAREARYRLLTAAAESIGARFIATAHTRDDKVETVLLRLLRGTGLRGLAGIPATRPLSPSVSLVRPMLACRRTEVLEYLGAIGQGFREDASNGERRFARNRVRHELLPMLREKFNADVDDAVLRVAELAGESQAVIEELADELFARCHGSCELGEGGVGRRITLATGPLADEREILVCEVLRRAWREARFSEQAMTNWWWRELAQFAQSTAEAGSLNLPGDVRATRTELGVLALTADGLS